MKRLIFAVMTAIGLQLTGAVEIADSFGLTEGRQPQVLVNQLNTEVGGATWQASDNLHLYGRGTLAFLSGKSANSFFARVPVLEEMKTITVSAEIHAVAFKEQTGAIKNEGWIALGIGPRSSELRLNWDNGFFILVQPSGVYQVIANYKGATSETIFVRRDEVPSYDPKGYTRVKISYSRANNSLNVWVNDEAVVELHKFSQRGFTPQIESAGFTGFAQKENVAGVKNFSLTTE